LDVADKVITIQEIKQRASGTVIDIPDWEPGGKIKVRVRRPDLIALLKKVGFAPNEFMGVIDDKQKVEAKVKETVGQAEDGGWESMERVLDAVAEASLIEPAFKDIQKVLPMTFQQKMEIFNWAMGEQRELLPFRAGAGVSGTDSGSKDVGLSS